MPEKEDNRVKLYKKMFKVMEAVEHIEKTTHIKYKSTDYKATAEEKITPIFRKEFLKNKLMVFPVEQVSLKSNGITRIDVKYKIVDTETGECEILASSGEGADTQDKGAGKAMTYAYKYMLLRTFMSPTYEDPDNTSSQELDDKNIGKSNGRNDKDIKDLLDLAFTSDKTKKAFLDSFKGNDKELKEVLNKRVKKEVGV